MIRRPPRSTQSRSSAASDVYKRQPQAQTVIAAELIAVLAVHEFAERGSELARRPYIAVSYTHLRAHETVLDLVCRLLLEKKKNTQTTLI